MMEKKKIGKFLWHDLTVDHHENVSNFHQQVVGWEKEEISMGEFNDFIIKDPSQNEVIA